MPVVGKGVIWVEYMPDRLDYSLKSGDGQELVFLYLQFYIDFHNSVAFGIRSCIFYQKKERSDILIQYPVSNTENSNKETNCG